MNEALFVGAALVPLASVAMAQEFAPLHGLSAPAAITVIGRGEHGLLVPTADGVREPQNRRVEIVVE